MKASTLFVLCVFYLKTTSTRGQIIDRLDIPSNPYRLPMTVLPKLYRVKLTPHMNNHTFDGEVEIYFRAYDDYVNRIIIHSRELENLTVDKSGSNVNIESINYDLHHEFVEFVTVSNLTKDVDYILRLNYVGKIRKSVEGFYSSSYEENTIKKEMGTTMSFPTNARTIFPCFDEPNYKAIFEISIDCPDNFKCISNMKENTNSNGLIKFEASPNMSTYLIAFVISDFVAGSENDDPKQFRIWTRPEAANMSRYAFEIGQKLIENMGEYTGISYYDMSSNIKMDHVAIPDFKGGAMENWGLITYREDNLLYDPDHSSIKYKQIVASVVAHETSHMWFGNLVTYDWFYYPWMSEGFASYFEFYLTESVEEFGMKDQFIGTQIHAAMQADSVSDVNPLTYLSVNTSDDISSHFNIIAYEKGASILRMIEHWIGAEDFKKSLRYYLANYKYKSVVPKNLFSTFDINTDVSYYNTTVENVMTDWTTKPGYPLLTVTIDKDNSSIITRQDRYYRHVIKLDLYPIPITYTTESTMNFDNTKPIFIQSEYQRSIPRLDDGWIIFNIQQTGYYRVLYESKLLYLIIDALNGESRELIHKYNRAQFVDDILNLGRDSYIDVDKMMDAIQFLENETDYVPWTAAYTGLSFWRIYTSRIEIIANRFDEHILRLMIRVIQSFEVAGDSNLMRLFRGNTMNFACSLGHTECIKNSTYLLQNLINNHIEIDPDHREYVYCNGLRYGNASDFDFLWMRYVKHNVASERSVLLSTLGCVKDDEKIKEYLLHPFTQDSKIRHQDRTKAFNSVLSGNRENVEIAFVFIKENINLIIEYDSSIVSMITSMSDRMSESQLERLQEFIDSTSALTLAQKATINISIRESKRILISMESKCEELLLWLNNRYK